MESPDSSRSVSSPCLSPGCGHLHAEWVRSPSEAPIDGRGQTGRPPDDNQVEAALRRLSTGESEIARQIGWGGPARTVPVAMTTGNSVAAMPTGRTEHPPGVTIGRRATRGAHGSARGIP